MKTLPN